MTLLILGIIGFIGGFILMLRTMELKEITFSEILMSIVVGILCSLVGICLGFLISMSIPSKLENKVTTYNIESLQDNSSVSGQFFLGSGIINGTMKYVFYYETDDNTYKMKELPHRNVSIKYTDEQPYYEKWEKVKTKDMINMFSIQLHKDIKYIIYVPKGTVQHNYNLDSK